MGSRASKFGETGGVRYARRQTLATSPRYGLTDRHVDLLGSLSWGALATGQLLKFSQTWAEPFTDVRQLRRQLARMAAAKLITSRPLATLTSGSPEHYHQLTAAGFRFLYGPSTSLPGASFFAPLALARQDHHRAVMDFLVHVAAGAHAAGVELRDLYPDGSVTLSTGLETIKPDAAFSLVAGEQVLRFYLEMDNATAALAASRPRDSIGQKLRVYESLQDDAAERFRVLIVSVRPTPLRLANIRRLAASLARNSNRSLCLTASLYDFLEQPEPLSSPLWLDHQERSQALLPAVAAWPMAVSQVCLTAAGEHP